MTARSKLPQKKCTGLHLPMNGQRAREKTRSHWTRMRQNRSACAGSYDAVRPCPRSKRIGFGNLDRHRPDVDRQLHVVERRHDVAVERRRRCAVRSGSDRVRRRPRCAISSWCSMKSNSIVNVRSPCGSGRVDETARGQLQRDRPAVIERRRLRERDLANDLRPHVQRRVCIGPGAREESGQSSLTSP